MNTTTKDPNPETDTRRVIDCAQLPDHASIRRWGKLLGVSPMTMRKRRDRGGLPVALDPRTNPIILSEKVVLDAFRKHTAFYRLIGENGSEKPARRKSKPQPSTA